MMKVMNQGLIFLEIFKRNFIQGIELKYLTDFLQLEGGIPQGRGLRGGKVIMGTQTGRINLLYNFYHSVSSQNLPDSR